MTQPTEQPSSSPKSKMGRKPYPFVVVTTTPNGEKKTQKGFLTAVEAWQMCAWYAHTEPLNETELIIRTYPGNDPAEVADLTLRVV